MKRRDIPKRKRLPRPKRKGGSDTDVRKGIVGLMACLGILAFAVVIGRLAKVMLADHAYYESRAISNQTRSTSVTATRGKVYDRNMDLLAASVSHGLVG